MADINRQQFLPAEISSEILAKTQTASAVMSLAKQVALPGRGIAIPVIVGDPEAAWVGETEKKPVSNSQIESKLLQPYKLAVIETVSAELARDAAGLYDELVRRLPNALAAKFDATVAGLVAAPGSNFDTFGSCTSQDLTYAGLTAADADIAANGGIMNGFMISPVGKSKLYQITDKNGRPLFINNATEGIGSQVLGSKAVVTKGVSGDVLAIAGDWTQAVYGTVEGIQIAISNEATVGNINTFEQNMIAIRAEIEIGFRADTSVFNKIGTIA